MSGLVKRIEGLSKNYMTNIEKETISYKKAGGDKEILRSWWLSLTFFFDTVFYQGRNDELSGRFERATIKALEDFLGKDDGQRLEKLIWLKNNGCLRWKQYEFEKDTFRKFGRCEDFGYSLTKQYNINCNGVSKRSSTGKPRDREMVVDALRFIADLH